MRERRIALYAAGLAEPTLHNRYTYNNWGCRCDVCTEDYRLKGLEAQKRRQQKYRAKQRAVEREIARAIARELDT